MLLHSLLTNLLEAQRLLQSHWKAEQVVLAGHNTTIRMPDSTSSMQHVYVTEPQHGLACHAATSPSSKAFKALPLMPRSALVLQCSPKHLRFARQRGFAGHGLQQKIRLGLHRVNRKGAGHGGQVHRLEGLGILHNGLGADGIVKLGNMGAYQGI